MIRWLAVLLLVVASGATAARAERPTRPLDSFEAATQRARDRVYLGERSGLRGRRLAVPVTFYCRCLFFPHGESGGRMDPTDCGFAATEFRNRAHRIEWERVVPAEVIAGRRACWTSPERFGDACVDADGERLDGEACCQRVDAEARHALNDLHNLVPVVGTLKAARPSHRYGIVEGESRRFGTCDIEIGGEPAVVEPTESLRGNIARIWLYMADAWDLPLAPALVGTLEEWNRADPIGAWERERDRRIEEIQGNRNPFVRLPGER